MQINPYLNFNGNCAEASTRTSSPSSGALARTALFSPGPKACGTGTCMFRP
jgi:hypothetical protein